MLLLGCSHKLWIDSIEHQLGATEHLEALVFIQIAPRQVEEAIASLAMHCGPPEIHCRVTSCDDSDIEFPVGDHRITWDKIVWFLPNLNPDADIVERMAIRITERASWEVEAVDHNLHPVTLPFLANRSRCVLRAASLDHGQRDPRLYANGRLWRRAASVRARSWCPQPLEYGLDLDARSTPHTCGMRHTNKRTGAKMPATQRPDLAIHVRGLRKSYKELEVLRGVDLDVERGCIFALLGSNGAGKTTVVKILCTLLKSDGGTASVGGFDVATQAADVRESISLTGQFAAVDEILNGHENPVLVARLRHLHNPATIAEGLLERVALSDAGGRKVSTYSGGMRRRIDIAMSLIGTPPVIFLDEPTTGLDPQGRIEVWQTVKELAVHGTTVLLTTQYLDEAEQLADRIAILHDGRIIANGTLAELRQVLPPAKVEYVEKQPTLWSSWKSGAGGAGPVSSECLSPK